MKVSIYQSIKLKDYFNEESVKAEIWKDLWDVNSGYRRVADLKLDDCKDVDNGLNSAYNLSNSYNKYWATNDEVVNVYFEKLRSTSVGDVIAIHRWDSRDFYVVAPFGFDLLKSVPMV